MIAFVDFRRVVRETALTGALAVVFGLIVIGTEPVGVAFAQSQSQVTEAASSLLDAANNALVSQSDRLNRMTRAFPVFTDALGAAMSRDLATGMLRESTGVETLLKTYPYVQGAIAGLRLLLRNDPRASPADIDQVITRTGAVLKVLAHSLAAAQAQRAQFLLLLREAADRIVQVNPSETLAVLQAKLLISPNAIDQEIIQQQLILTQLRVVLSTSRR